MKTQRLNISSGAFDLSLQADDQHFFLKHLGLGDFSWLHPASRSNFFAVTIDGQQWDASNLKFDQAREDHSAAGVRQVVLTFVGDGITVEQHLKAYEDSPVVEVWPVVHNHGETSFRVERLDSLDLNTAEIEAELFYYTGNWGSEFEPHRTRISKGDVVIEARSGRSSKGNHPWFALTEPGGQVLSASVAWSGNWVFRFEALPAGGCKISGGLNDWQFYKDLQPGESLEGAPVVLVLGPNLNAVSQAYARVGRKHWYPRNAFAGTQPVEWNHWWPYEDAEINEAVFAKNVAAAAPLGFEVCTLDAGWFGPSDAGTFWEHYRGDWDLVNDERFPNGIRAVADNVHGHGMKFGIWCEIEGLGVRAQVAKDHPEYVALRDGEWLGGVCFGNPQVQEWAYATLARLIDDYQADWIKVDFNLDLGAGCNRTDHGHQSGDGLYAHIQGYYGMLERVRRDFPQVVLENCSSGGLRIDLGMLRRTDMTFLSDPDWPVHDLQIFWGASTMLAPNVLLHWTYSDWRNLNPPPYQTFDPHDRNFTPQQWDYYSRISMLGLYGLSQKLPDLPDWMTKRVAVHNAIYKNHVRRFVREADLYRLTEQPRRSGEGERWAAFQYSLPDQSQHLLFVFKMQGGESERAIRLQGLEPDRLYNITGFEGEVSRQMTGRVLMEQGLNFSIAEEEGSALLGLA